jgi:ketosteroid isomerase-like protein
MGVAGIDDFAGRDGYMEFTRRWTEDFEEFALEPEQIVGADDDRVVVTTHTRGAGKGSGATVDMRTAWVVTLEAGRIVNVVLSWSRTMHSKPWDCGSSPRPKFGRRGSSAFRATSS